MAILLPQPWVNPFGKMAIFRPFKILVFIAYKGVSSFENIVKYIFLAYIAWKKKVGKMVIFGLKPWVNPFAKISIFDFNTSCFYTLERRFLFLEYRKRHFPGLYCLKKKMLEK